MRLTNIIKVTSIATLLFLLVSCCTPEIITHTVVTDPLNTCLTPPKAHHIIMEDVNFSVIQDDTGLVWVAMNSQGYKKMSKNMKEIIQNLKEKNAIIRYYEECNDESDA